MTHKEIQTALDYIEANIYEKLTLDEVSQTIGFSKFYFHRCFQKEVGLSLYDYIRRRRLACAASLLLNTNISVLDIALTFQFESQEAFTRAFKSIYNLPPGRYRTAIKNLTKGISDMKTQNNIKDWIITGTAPDKYHIGLDSAIYHLGTKSATIKSITSEYTNDEYGTIMQQINAAKYLGRRMRFSGFVRTLDVEGWCALWFRIDNALSTTLKLDNMQNRPIKGTTEWNHYTCVLDVPENSAILNIGMLLQGKGQAWVDNVSFEEVDYSVPVTEFTIETTFPDHVLNPSFEEL